MIVAFLSFCPYIMHLFLLEFVENISLHHSLLFSLKSLDGSSAFRDQYVRKLLHSSFHVGVVHCFSIPPIYIALDWYLIESGSAEIFLSSYFIQSGRCGVLNLPLYISPCICAVV